MRLLPGRLLWRTLLVLVAALLLSQATAWWLFEEYVSRPRVGAMVGQFTSHLKTLGAALQSMDPAQQQAFIARVAEADGIRITAGPVPERLRPAPDRPPMRLFREHIRRHFGPEAEVYRGGGPLEGRPRMLWVRLPAGEREYWVAFPRQRIERDTATAVAAWALAGVAIAVLGTVFLVWRLNRPLVELARAAARLGRGEHPPPVAETGPTEIREVARAFNQMNEGLRRIERDRATFLAGISHDLRTPLARLRLDVEMLEGRVDGAVQSGMVADIHDMNAIIDQFIDYTRTETDEPLSAVHLPELARACAERAVRAGAKVACELDDGPLLMLRPLAMQRLVDNLLGNAARHAGGEVVLRVAQSADAATVSVLDRGPGIPAELVEHLKKPFTRRDEARSGSSGAGLGLAIVNRVATLHGGRLELLAREGGGLEARVTLPVVPGDAAR